MWSLLWQKTTSMALLSASEDTEVHRFFKEMRKDCHLGTLRRPRICVWLLRIGSTLPVWEETDITSRKVTLEESTRCRRWWKDRQVCEGRVSLT